MSSLSNRNMEEYGIDIVIGSTEDGGYLVKDLAGIEHLLVTGNTSSGKSVFLHSLIGQIIQKKGKNNINLILIDPKIAEFQIYKELNIVPFPDRINGSKSYDLLRLCADEVITRSANGEYKCSEESPILVIVIDEFSDIVLSNNPSEIDHFFNVITSTGHKVGVHLILSTSITSDRVLLKSIRENIHNRLTGTLTLPEDSLFVIEEVGAEKLGGMRDMIYKNLKTKETRRLETSYMSPEFQRILLEKEIKGIDYDEVEAKGKDVLFEDAKRLVIEEKQATTSFLQRRLKIGYNQSARLIEQLEKYKVITHKEGSKTREILLNKYTPPKEDNNK